MSYLIHGEKALYVKDVECMGIKLKCHRPVSLMGVRSKDGWAFSLNGWQVAIIKGRVSQKEAIKKFKDQCKRAFKTGAELRSRMLDVSYENREKWVEKSA